MLVNNKFHFHNGSDYKPKNTQLNMINIATISPIMLTDIELEGIFGGDWSWSAFTGATVVGAVAGAAGGAAVGAVGGLGVGAGPGAVAGGIGGAVSGAVGYAGSYLWERFI